MARLDGALASRSILALRGAVIIAILVVPAVTGGYWRFFSFQMVVACYLAVSFDLAYSYGKILTFMQSTFFAVGAYVAIYSASTAPWALALVLAAAVLSGAVCGAIAGGVLVRMNGHNATIATVILAAAGLLAGNALSAYTGGEDGLQLPAHSIGIGAQQIATGASLGMYYIAALVLVALVLARWGLQRSRMWKVLCGVAENETRAQQLGFNVRLRRVIVFTLAASVAALGGAFYALLMQQVTTHVLEIGQSVNGILWAVVGGLGTAFGALVGVLVVFPVTEIVSNVFVYVQIFVGLLLVVAAVFFPGGIMGTLREVGQARMAGAPISANDESRGAVLASERGLDRRKGV